MAAAPPRATPSATAALLQQALQSASAARASVVSEPAPTTTSTKDDPPGGVLPTLSATISHASIGPQPTLPLPTTPKTAPPPIRSPALPPPLLDRVLRYCRLRDLPQISRVSREVRGLVKKPHIIVDLFYNSYHPSLALLKALELYPDFDLALAQSFCQWYRPLPRYVLQQLRLERRGNTPSTNSLSSGSLSPPSSASPTSPTSPSQLSRRIPKDAYIYLMTQGYCRYVKPDLNIFLVEDDDLSHFYFLISELADADTRNLQKECLSDIWELVTQCNVPMMLLTERLQENPVDLAYYMYKLHLYSLEHRYESFNVVAAAGFNFQALNVGWERGGDHWTALLEDQLDLMDADERGREVKYWMVPFVYHLHYLGCRFAPRLLNKLIGIMSRLNDLRAIETLVHVGRTAGRPPFIQVVAPPRSFPFFRVMVAPIGRAILDNFTFLANRSVPLFEIAWELMSETIPLWNHPNDARLSNAILASVLLHPDYARRFEIAKMGQRTPELIQAVTARLAQELNAPPTQEQMIAAIEHETDLRAFQSLIPQLAFVVQPLAIRGASVVLFSHFILCAGSVSPAGLEALFEISRNNAGLTHVWRELIADQQIQTHLITAIKNAIVAERRKRREHAAKQAAAAAAANAGSSSVAPPQEAVNGASSAQEPEAEPEVTEQEINAYIERHRFPRQQPARRFHA